MLHTQQLTGTVHYDHSQCLSLHPYTGFYDHNDTCPSLLSCTFHKDLANPNGKVEVKFYKYVEKFQSYHVCVQKEEDQDI